MAQLIDNVVIVGGGSAGWLAAVHIRCALGPQSTVTLIESPSIPTIGVGEGTQPSLRAQFEAMRIDVEDCMKATGASYKNGIRFVGWNTPGQGDRVDQGDFYFHPFFSGQTGSLGAIDGPMHYWLRLHAEGGQAPDGTPLPPLAEVCWHETALIRSKKSPITFRNGQRVAQPISNFALHLDAAKLGLYLRDIGVQRGVRHIIDDVTDVSTDAAGNITGVHTVGHGPVGGQLFIDCTGFHRKLIKVADPHNDFIDFGSSLLNDRAVTARIAWPTDAPRGIESATVSTALSAGWAWEVPLYERCGTGYVYSSAHISDDDAEREFRAFLRSKGYEPKETSRVRYQTGRMRRAWSGNCVAVGLSSGFIEPLEATGIALISYQLFRLLELWPRTEINPILRDRFNAAMQRSFEWTRDFIVLHYCLSARRDTDYWRYVTSDEAVPESLRSLLEMFDERWPFGEITAAETGYRLPDESIACVLAGFGRFPRSRNPYIAGLRIDHVRQRVAEHQQRARSAVQVTMDHDRWLMLLNGHLG